MKHIKIYLILFFITISTNTAFSASNTSTANNNSSNQDLKIKIVDLVTAKYNSALTIFNQKIKSTEKIESKKYFLTQKGNLLEIEYNFTTASILGKDQLGKISVFESIKSNDGQLIRGRKLISLIGVEIQLTDIHKIQVLESTNCQGFAVLSSLADKTWALAVGFDNGCTQDL